MNFWESIQNGVNGIYGYMFGDGSEGYEDEWDSALSQSSGFNAVSLLGEDTFAAIARLRTLGEQAASEKNYEEAISLYTQAAEYALDKVQQLPEESRDQGIGEYVMPLYASLETCLYEHASASAATPGLKEYQAYIIMFLKNSARYSAIGYEIQYANGMQFFKEIVYPKMQAKLTADDAHRIISEAITESRVWDEVLPDSLLQEFQLLGITATCGEDEAQTTDVTATFKGAMTPQYLQQCNADAEPTEQGPLLPNEPQSSVHQTLRKRN